MVGLPACRWFKKSIISREKSGDSVIVLSLFSCYSLSNSVLLNSGAGRESESAKPLIKRRAKFISGFFCAFYFNRRSNN